MRPLFKSLILSVLMVLCGVITVQALESEAPVIALSNNAIYAVSPHDGTSRLLVERDAVQDAALDQLYVNSTLSLSPISPDGTKFAYIAPLYEILDPAFASEVAQTSQIRPTDITLVDIASGTQTPITRQGATFAEAVAQHKLETFSNLLWSVDGQRLYFETTIESLRNRVPQTMIEYYDLKSGERRVLLRLNAHTQLMGIYALVEGLVTLVHTDNDIAFEFTLYDDVGTVLSVVNQSLPDWMGSTNSTMFTMNPVFQADAYWYGYYGRESQGVIPSLLNTATGETSVLVEGLYPAFISHAHAATSLRIVQVDPYGQETIWEVADAEGHLMSDMSLKGVVLQSEIALSPRGDTIAFLKPGSDYGTPVSIVLMDAKGKRELDFKATQIQWGAIDYTFSAAESEG